VSRIDQLIAEHCPDGVPYLPMGEVGEFVRGSGLQKVDFTDVGAPCIHYGQIYTFYGISAKETKSFVSPDLASRLKKAPPQSLLMTTTSENIEDVGKSVAWLGESDVVFGGHACAFIHTLDPMYATFIVQSRDFQTQKDRFVKGTKVKDISTKELAKIKIPVPPIEIQREISQILQDMNSLQAELAARRSQYEFYRDSLLSFNNAGTPPWRWMTLGEISKRISSGGTPLTTKPEYYGGEIPWLRTQEVNFDVITSTGVSITELGLTESSANWIPANSVVVAMYGATVAKVAVTGIPLTTNQACCNLEIDDSIALFRYVFHWISREYENLKSLGQGSQTNINAQIVKSYKIPVPSLNEQQRIVEILDNFDALVNDISIGLPAEIKARRQQYEYYRDQLLSFKELAA